MLPQMTAAALSARPAMSAFPIYLPFSTLCRETRWLDRCAGRDKVMLMFRLNGGLIRESPHTERRWQVALLGFKVCKTKI